jgi:hypothetical protein
MFKIQNIFGKKQQYYLIIVLRFITPFSIFEFPLFAIISSLFLDNIDTEFASRGIKTKTQNQLIDKIFDTWWYTVVLVYSYFSLNEYFWLLLILYLYRLIGAIVLWSRKDRSLLMLFPNMYENFFFLFFFATHFESLRFLIIGVNFYYSIFIIALAKLIQEYWLHVAQLSIREDIFKLKRNWLPEH